MSSPLAEVKLFILIKGWPKSQPDASVIRRSYKIHAEIIILPNFFVYSQFIFCNTCKTKLNSHSNGCKV